MPPLLPDALRRKSLKLRNRTRQQNRLGSLNLSPMCLIDLSAFWYGKRRFLKPTLYM